MHERKETSRFVDTDQSASSTYWSPTMSKPAEQLSSSSPSGEEKLKPSPVVHVAKKFFRPHYQVFGPTRKCVACHLPLKVEDHCATCGYGICKRESCEMYKIRADFIHSKEYCAKNDMAIFEGHLRNLFGFADKPDKPFPREYMEAILYGFQVYDMLANDKVYKLPHDEQGRTNQWMEWWLTSFPKRLPEQEALYMGNMPSSHSDTDQLGLPLFAALMAGYDTSAENKVQTFISAYFFMARRIDVIGAVTDVITRGQPFKYEQVQAFTNFIMVDRVLDTDPPKESGLIEAVVKMDHQALPGTFLQDIYKRNVVHSLVLFSFTSLDYKECMYRWQKGPKPEFFFTLTIIGHVSRRPNGDVSLRLVNAMHRFYSYGQWLNGNLPSSDFKDVKVKRTPLASTVMKDMAHIKCIAEAMNNLVALDGKISAEGRRDAFEIVTGVRFEDPARVPRFIGTTIEGNLTV